MKFFISYCLVFSFSITFLFSQSMEWDEIDPADLQMTVYEKDTSAAAVVLSDIGEIRLDFSNQGQRSVLKRHVRIKILRKSGLSEGDIEIPHHEEYHYLHDISLQTIDSNGIQYFTSKDDIFIEERDEGWKIAKISAPQLAIGSIIEYQYTLDTKYISALPTWYFQTDIPIRNSILDVYLPSWVNYVFIINNPKLITKKQLNDQFSNATDKNKSVRFHRHFAAEHLPAIKEESYVANIDDHRTNVQFQLSEYAPPSGGYYKFFEDWKRTARELLEHPDLGKQITQSRYSRKITEQTKRLIGNTKSDFEKVQMIYKFLQKKIEWNEKYRSFTDSNLDKCFVNGVGNSGEINMIALVMLQKAGLNAHPVLISTRTNGKHIVDYPIVSQFNHLLVLVKINGKDILLDATDTYRPIGFIDEEALNNKGFLVKWDEYQWIDINPQKGKDIIAANLELNADGQLTGEVKTRCIGYSAISERALLAEAPAGNFWLDRFNEQFTEVEIGDMEFQNVADLEKPLTNSFKIEIDDATQVIDDFIYLNPTLYSNFLENPFKLERREYPVEIPYPFQQQTILNLKIPTGYEVTELPDPAKMVLPDQGGQLLYSITEKEGSIQLSTKIEVNQLIHEPHEYPNLKTFFDLIIEKQGEQIVFKKVKG